MFVGDHNIICVNKNTYYNIYLAADEILRSYSIQERINDMNISSETLKRISQEFEDGRSLVIENKNIQFKTTTKPDEKYCIIMLYIRKLIMPIDKENNSTIYYLSPLGQNFLAILDNDEIIKSVEKKLTDDGFKEKHFGSLLFDIIYEKAKSYTGQGANMDFNQQVNIAMSVLNILGKSTGQEKLVADIFNKLVGNENVPQEFRDSMATAMTENAGAITHDNNTNNVIDNNINVPKKDISDINV